MKRYRNTELKRWRVKVGVAKLAARLQTKGFYFPPESFNFPNHEPATFENNSAQAKRCSLASNAVDMKASEKFKDFCVFVWFSVRVLHQLCHVAAGLCPTCPVLPESRTLNPAWRFVRCPVVRAELSKAAFRCRCIQKRCSKARPSPP